AQPVSRPQAISVSARQWVTVAIQRLVHLLNNKCYFNFLFKKDIKKVKDITQAMNNDTFLNISTSKKRYAG
ncbi:hypothetical protein, partial [Enterobacter hormaechei]|uniref:hypothetical protein n=2 Tax=Enterobacter hormaechei TaxID=158836 RepID=UPI001C8E8562